MTTWTATAAALEGPPHATKATRVRLDNRGLVVLAETCLGFDDPPEGEPFSQEVVEQLGVHGAAIDALDSPERLTSWLRERLDAAHFRTLATRHGHDGNASVVALVMAHGMWSLASVGDARAYRLHAGGVELLVRDHSLFTTLCAQGELTDDDFFSFPHASVVCELLGANEVITLRTRCERAVPGESIVVCTQGLWQALGPVATHRLLERLRVTPMFDAAELVAALPREGREAACVVLHFS